MLSLKAARAGWDTFPECSSPGTMILRMHGYQGWCPWEGKEKKPVYNRICCAGALYTLMLALLIPTLGNQLMNLKLLSKTLNNQRSLLIQLFASCFSCWKSYIFYFRTGSNEFQVLPHKRPEKQCYRVWKALAGRREERCHMSHTLFLAGRRKERCHMSHLCPWLHHRPGLSCPSLCKC